MEEETEMTIQKKYIVSLVNNYHKQNIEILDLKEKIEQLEKANITLNQVICDLKCKDKLINQVVEIVESNII